jgi:transposase, IS5 family
MQQRSLASSGFELKAKRTRKREFLEEMERVVPWAELVGLIEPHAAKAGLQGGRPAFAVPAMLRIHFMQQWFGHSDSAMEEALYDVPVLRDFARLDIGVDRIPDESTILRFRHMLEANGIAQQIFALVRDQLVAKGLLLKEGTIVDATLIAAAPSTKNRDKARDPQMHQSKKGNQWHFGMKAHIGVDDDSGLVHAVICTAGNVSDVCKANELLQGQETHACGDAGYQGADKREEARQDIKWDIAMKRGKRKALDKGTLLGGLIDQVETIKSQIRAKVEHVFRVVKCQFGYRKVRYKGLAKNEAQINTLMALANLYQARRALDRQGQVRAQDA